MPEITTAHRDLSLHFKNIISAIVLHLLQTIMHTFLPTVCIFHLFPCQPLHTQLTVISGHLP